MPVVKIPFKPGVNKEITSYAVEGGFFNCDKIRFRSGFAEKIGGWINYSYNNTFVGVGRTLLNWVSYNPNGYNCLALGTNQKYYVEYSGIYNDITPIRTTFTGLTNPFATVSGSPLVTVTIAGHSTSAGSFVTFSGATAVNGLTLNGQYEVITTPDGSTFTIIASANASGTGTGGGTVTAVFTINAGSGVVASALGWGNGGWGGQVGVANTGWGMSGPTSSSTSIPLQIWSQCNFNQDLIFSPSGGPLYYWAFDSTFASQGVTLNAYAGTQAKGTAIVSTGGVGVSTIVVDNNYYITSGATISFVSGSGGSSIPAGTYVTTAYTNGFTVTLSGNVTLSAGDIVSFSYAGYSVPNATNKVIAFSTYQFIIALGANPYNPFNFNTTFSPMLVRWSDQANAYEWVPQLQNQAGSQILSNGSYLITAVATRQEVVIWSNSAMYSMQYIGPPYVFSFSLLMDSVSIISPNAAITANNTVYFMGIDRFYMYNGTVQPLPCTLKRYIYSNLNTNQLNQIVSGYNEGFNEVWWMYPSKTSNVNDSYVIYNYLDNLWYYGSLNRTAWLNSQLRPYPMAMFSAQLSYLSVAIGSADTSLTLINGSSYPSTGLITIDSEQMTYSGVSGNSLTGLTRGVNGTTAATHAAYAKVTYSVPNQVIYHENGLDDGTISLTSPSPIASYIESADISIGDGHKFGFVTRALPDITFTNSTATNPTVYMTLEPRQNSGSAYTTTVGGNAIDVMAVTNTALPAAPTYTFPVEQYTGQVYTRVRGRQIAMKFYSVDLGVQWQIGAMRFDIKPDGRR